MAITVAGITNSTTDTTSVVVPASTEKLIVTVSGGHGVVTPATSGVTYGGVAMTLAKRQNSATQGVEIYFLDSPTAGTANVVVTWGTSVSSRVITASALNGAASGAPEATGGTTDTDANNTTATTVTSLTDGAVSIEAWAAQYNNTGSPVDGQTELHDAADASGSSLCGGSAYLVLGAAGLYTQDYNWSGTPNRVNYAIAVWAPGTTPGNTDSGTNTAPGNFRPPFQTSFSVDRWRA